MFTEQGRLNCNRKNMFRTISKDQICGRLSEPAHGIARTQILRLKINFLVCVKLLLLYDDCYTVLD